MSKIYLDANIIIDLILESREFHNEIFNLLKEHISNNGIIATSNLNLNTIFFIVADRAKRYEAAKSFLKTVINSKSWEIYDINLDDIRLAVDMMDENDGADFEDLQQYIAAKNSGCDLIITNDKDFLNFDIKVKRTNPNIK
ncbi:type II toxin-antitoxin system VapC family toxin [Campylobacter sp. RM9344]|uniref:Type II toxin-antitoxin system VapC family toxin n=1 Tax=Campylobacter californiensis TaxID=1032243 RepID=A0AAW3ZVE5_9BACT|nr:MULTISPECIES: PIN domain-containing protein [unclassified Campylobacter]MBE2985454.1 type II toxin-antitoxin system VapC family toxin [Campylobacter sp. RM6883]MBE2987251.1 type II toxin-antitoxin system VapC family toxin [Campylobacter sp. RM12919]MBE2989014.1 type II toxin-antitoxin system VapC family toxin [Campylobacter sp. RM12920]MBE2996022.1 type II toxin-antitoxin system VapC family toxin [Campylobacter sp. RM6913]MBE3030323.1 type II toxin-antitoxin system VapC family toxin [Campyl